MFYVDNQVVNKDSFISTFLICIPFLFFCFLPAIARTCSIMLKRDKRRHPCLLLDLNVKASSFSLKYDVSYSVFIDNLHQVEKVAL